MRFLPQLLGILCTGHSQMLGTDHQEGGSGCYSPRRGSRSPGHAAGWEAKFKELLTVSEAQREVTVPGLGCTSPAPPWVSRQLGEDGCLISAMERSWREGGRMAPSVWLDRFCCRFLSHGIISRENKGNINPFLKLSVWKFMLAQYLSRAIKCENSVVQVCS